MHSPHYKPHALCHPEAHTTPPDSDNIPEIQLRFSLGTVHSHIPECLPCVPGFEQGARPICSLSQQSFQSDGDSPLSRQCPTAMPGAMRGGQTTSQLLASRSLAQPVAALRGQGRTQKLSREAGQEECSGEKEQHEQKFGGGTGHGGAC